MTAAMTRLSWREGAEFLTWWRGKEGIGELVGDFFVVIFSSALLELLLGETGSIWAVRNSMAARRGCCGEFLRGFDC